MTGKLQKVSQKKPRHWKKACVKLYRDFVKAAGNEQELEKEVSCLIETAEGHVPAGKNVTTLSSGIHSAQLSLNEIDQLLKNDNKIVMIEGANRMQPR